MGEGGAIDKARTALGAGSGTPRLRRWAAIALLLLAGMPVYGAGQARVEFDIPAQPLASALLELGRQAGLSIAVPDNFPRDRASEPLNGAMTSEQALALLLKDVPARFTFVDRSEEHTSELQSQ